MSSRPATQTAARPEVPYYVKTLALAVPAILLGLQLSGWVGFVPVIRDGHADFRNLYTAGYMVRTGHGHELYNYSAQKGVQDALVSREEIAIPFIRPAYQALVFAPFSLLPFRWAYCAFLLLNLAVLCYCYKLLRPRMGRLAQVWPGLPFGMFLFIPIGAALMQGQDSILLLALLATALVALEKGQDFTAGALIGLGLFKFQLVIPIALLFVAWRRWRFSAGFALSAIGLAALSTTMVGWSALRVYMRSMLSLSATQNLSSGIALPVNRMANLHGMLFGIFDGQGFVAPLTVAASAIVFAIAALRRPQKAESLALAITIGAVVSYYLFIHDMSVLLIPVAWALDSSIASEGTADRIGRIRGRAAAALFAAPACMSFIPNHFYLVAIPVLFFAVVITLPSQVEPVTS
jgi:hypothetical protein